MLLYTFILILLSFGVYHFDYRKNILLKSTFYFFVFIVSTLMMVGIVTLPVEVKYFGKKISYTRNVLAFMFSFIVAIVVGMAVTNL